MAQLLLIILDGWGYRKNKNANAIAKAETPIFNQLWKNNPHTILKASGEAVGLPRNTIGNSEVGHLTLGAGRIVPQSLLRINQSIKDLSFFENEEFKKAIAHCKKYNTNLHLMGLIQDQGVHAMSSHALAILQLCHQQRFNKVLFHAFTDGRDTHPKSAKKFITEIEKALSKYRVGRIATLSGRFYAMDRDKRWQRTKKAYDAVITAKGRRVKTSSEALKRAYKKREFDEFITPTIIGGYEGVQSNDAILFFNFRYDRARQLTKAITDPLFTEFERSRHPHTYFVAMTPYYAGMKAHVAFPEFRLKNTLSEVLSTAHLRQLRVAETEKYAHVTYFFNGEKEPSFPGEDRLLIKSRREIRTYDKKPAMRAREVAQAVIDALHAQKHEVIIANFANADMVGHTGNIKAAIKAIEVLDECLGRVVAAAGDIPILITADHGNAEQKGGKWQTAHTTNPVPFILVNRKLKLKRGGLANVAPTILELLNINKPEEMDVDSLIVK